MLIDEVYVIACPKAELHFDEHKRANREKENKRAQLKVSSRGVSNRAGDRRELEEKRGRAQRKGEQVGHDAPAGEDHRQLPAAHRPHPRALRGPQLVQGPLLLRGCDPGEAASVLSERRRGREGGRHGEGDRQEGAAGEPGSVLGLGRRRAGGHRVLPARAGVHGGALPPQRRAHGPAVLPAPSLPPQARVPFPSVAHRSPQSGAAPSLHRRCPPSHCKRVAVVLCQPTADQHTPPCVLVDYENGGCPSQPGRRMAPLLCILQRADAGRLYTAPVPGVLRGGMDRAAHSSAGGGGGRGHERLLGAREPPAVLRLPGLRDLAEPADAAGQVPAVQAARGLRERARVVAVRGARGGVQQPAAPAAARVEALPAVQAAARGVHRAVQAARAAGGAGAAAQAGGQAGAGGHSAVPARGAERAGGGAPRQEEGAVRAQGAQDARDDGGRVGGAAAGAADGAGRRGGGGGGWRAVGMGRGRADGPAGVGEVPPAQAERVSGARRREGCGVQGARAGGAVPEAAGVSASVGLHERGGGAGRACARRVVAARALPHAGGAARVRGAPAAGGHVADGALALPTGGGAAAGAGGEWRRAGPREHAAAGSGGERAVRRGGGGLRGAGAGLVGRVRVQAEGVHTVPAAWGEEAALRRQQGDRAAQDAAGKRGAGCRARGAARDHGRGAGRVPDTGAAAGRRAGALRRRAGERGSTAVGGERVRHAGDESAGRDGGAGHGLRGGQGAGCGRREFAARFQRGGARGAVHRAVGAGAAHHARGTGGADGAGAAGPAAVRGAAAVAAGLHGEHDEGAGDVAVVTVVTGSVTDIVTSGVAGSVAGRVAGGVASCGPGADGLGGGEGGGRAVLGGRAVRPAAQPAALPARRLPGHPRPSAGGASRRNRGAVSGTGAGRAVRGGGEAVLRLLAARLAEGAGGRRLSAQREGGQPAVPGAVRRGGRGGAVE